LTDDSTELQREATAQTVSPPASMWNESSEDVTPEPSGRYVPRDEELGRGGIGRVYVAFDRHIGREVAIKELLPAPVADAPEAVEDRMRFLREARVTGQLEHPGIVPVYEVGRRPDGRLYYAMKLVRGRTLRTELDASTGLQDRLRLLTHFRDLCNAIAFAHSRAVVHRDLKPDNIMVGEFGRTVVLDWGLTKVRGESQDLSAELRSRAPLRLDGTDSDTRSGSILGTPAYMSPEQARGEVDRVDERSDVWSLGAVLFEILTGEPPFGKTPATEVLMKVVEGRASKVAEVEPEAPPDLGAIADKALNRAREDRYTDAKEMAQDLDAFMSGRRVAAYDYTSWDLLRKFVRENQTLTYGVLGVVFAILVGSVTTFAAYRQAVVERERARAAEQAAVEAQQRSEASDREANRHLSEALVEQARLLAKGRNFAASALYATSAAFHSPWIPSSPHRYPDLEARDPRARALGVLPIRSGLYWPLVQRHMVLEWVPEVRDVCALAANPKGRHAVSVDRSKRMIVWDLLRHRPIQQAELDACPRYLAHASNVVAFADAEGPIGIWDLEGPVKKIRARNGRRGLALSPDGRFVFEGGMDGVLRRFDVRTGSVRGKARIRDPRSVAVSPDGRTVVVGTRWGEVGEFDARTLAPRARHSDHGSSVWAIAFHPKGDGYATAGFEGVVVWRREGETVKLQRGEPVVDLGFSDSGRFLLGAGVGPAQLWSVDQPLPVEQFSRDPRGVEFLISATEDRFLVREASGGMSMWRLEEATSAQRLSGHTGPVWTIATRGNDVVTVDSAGWIRWWDGPNETLRWSHQEPALWSATFGPTGQRVYAVTSRGRVIRLEPNGEVKVLQKNIPGRTDSQIGIASSEELVAWPGAPGEVVLFDEARDRRIGRLKGLSGPITTVAFSGTGRFAAANRTGGVAVWDPTSRVRVWVREDAHPSIVTGLAFVPGTDRLASAGKDGRIRFWSAADGRPGPVWSGHENWVNQIRFSPDGRWLLTASDDETARLWDMETGLPRLSLDASTQVTGIAFSEEPTRFWVGIDDTVHGLPTQLDALDLPVETLVADAEEKSGMRVAGFRLEPIAANEHGAP